MQQSAFREFLLPPPATICRWRRRNAVASLLKETLVKFRKRAALLRRTGFHRITFRLLAFLSNTDDSSRTAILQPASGLQSSMKPSQRSSGLKETPLEVR